MGRKRRDFRSIETVERQNHEGVDRTIYIYYYVYYNVGLCYFFLHTDKPFTRRWSLNYFYICTPTTTPLVRPAAHASNNLRARHSVPIHNDYNVII